VEDEKRCEHGYPVGGLCQLCRGLQRAVDAGYLSPGNGPQPMSDEKPSPSPWVWSRDNEGRPYALSSRDDIVCAAEVTGPRMGPAHFAAMSEANAALIADAWQLPQLREENREMRELLRQIADVPPEPQGESYEDRCLASRGGGWHRRALALLDEKKRAP